MNTISDLHAELTALNRLFMDALLALAQVGETERACRLAAKGWSALRRQYPREAERLNGVLHSLTRISHPKPDGGNHVRSKTA